MLALLLAATLNVGVYYTFPAENVLIHNKNDELKIEKYGFDVRKAVKDLLENAETTINKEVFGGQKAIELKPAFIEYWRIENPPIVEYATNIDEIWPLVEKLYQPVSVDFYLILFANEIVLYNPYENGFEKANGAVRISLYKLPNHLFGDILVLGNFISAKNKNDTFRHELGHILGLADTDCKKLIIMCGAGMSNRKIDESYKQAWRDFYESRTGQKFQPSS